MLKTYAKILIFFLFLLALASCSPYADNRFKSRLAHADTLATCYPDSALNVLHAINENVARQSEFMRIANYFYPCLGLLTILRYSIQGLGYSNLSMMSGVMEMIARCGVSLWLVPALAWTGVCFGDPVAWGMADLFLIPAFLWLYKHLKKEQVR